MMRLPFAQLLADAANTTNTLPQKLAENKTMRELTWGGETWMEGGFRIVTTLIISALVIWLVVRILKSPAK